MKRLWIMPVLFVAVLMGGVGIAQATGAWVTTRREAVVAGQPLTVDDVKGWMTLQQAAEGVGLTVADLAGLISPDKPTLVKGATAFKDVETLVPGFELTAFKEQVRALLAARGTVPGQASATPTATSTATPTTSPTAAPTPSPSGTATPQGTPTASDAQAIRGSTTLRQVAATYGLDVARLAHECGLPADVNVDATLKDLTSTVAGFEIQAVRDAVARLK
ncbi:MAG: hypothetical protein WAV45_09055 [Propionibacteriaceae bacterium]|nr:hypothetical protein [Micropruina sp.]